jgi:O-acetylhomoserine (thiol)-lyase
MKFVESLKIVSHLANVGDCKTLIIQPAATTHSQLSTEALHAAGLSESMLRISVGIEHIDDLTNDFETAFKAAFK